MSWSETLFLSSTAVSLENFSKIINMAGTGRWRMFSKFVRHYTTEMKTGKAVVTSLCVASGSGIAIYSCARSYMQPQWQFSHLKINSVLAAESSSQQLLEERAPKSDIQLNTREKRFHDFASVEIEGEHFMTPQDFLESVTEETPRPRMGRLQLAENEVKSILLKTPDRKKNSSRFFRSLHNQGLISYTEYLFFLCILTKPKSGFNIAFNMFDADGNQRVDKKEFMVLGEIFRKRTESAMRRENAVLQRSSTVTEKHDQTLRQLRRAIKESNGKLQDTTLLIHLFGKKGNNDLQYEDFHRFMDNLQTEVLEIEFLTYSHGLVTISEEDFGRMLLKYTDIADSEESIKTLRKRIPEEKGITFEDFRSFFQFLNNLEDFAIAMQMYTLAGRSIGQSEFKRAVQISTGHELSEHLVNTLFQLFDKDGDNRLSQVEFIGVMKDRIHRGFRSRFLKHGHGWAGFNKCVRNYINSSKSSS